MDTSHSSSHVFVKRFALGMLCALAGGACTLPPHVPNFDDPFPDFDHTLDEVSQDRTVVFDKNNRTPGSTEAAPQSKTVTPPATTVDRLPEEPTRPGYTFLRWDTEREGTGSPFTENTPIGTATYLTVYAQWEFQSPEPKKEGVVFGRLKNAKGGVVGNAQISVGSTTLSTNESGFFFLELEAGQEHLLQVKANGFARTSQRVQAQVGVSSFVEISLLPFGKTQTLNATAGGEIETDGTKVSFPAGALDAAGNVTAHLAQLNADERAQLAAFPGGFRTRDGELLESFGALAIEVYDAEGKPVNLKPGANAQVFIPPSSNLSTDNVPLWAYDEETSLWREEGVLTGCQGASGCTANIPHLSWWNADIVMETSCLTVCATDTHNTPTAGISFEARGVNYNSISTAVSGTDGCACFAVRVNSKVKVVGVTSGGVTDHPAEVDTGNIPLSCGSAACQKLSEPLKVAAPKFQAILTWGAKPSDLDAHFTGPCPHADCSSERFHVHYSSRGSLSSAPFAYLDTDDTSSYGPEITSLAICAAGTYRYSVHNYSGESSWPLVNSEAKVLVLLPDGNIHTYAAPPSNPEGHDLWVVGELTCAGASCQCSWTPLNIFTRREDGIETSGG